MSPEAIIIHGAETGVLEETHPHACAGVTKSGRILHYNDPSEQAAIVVELEGMYGEWPRPSTQIDAIVQLIQGWMEEFEIDIDNVFRDADIDDSIILGNTGKRIHKHIRKELTR